MDNLIFYDFTNSAPIIALDLGTVAGRSSDDTIMRVANTSDTYQAENVIIAVAGDYPEARSQLWVSTDGDIFTAQIDIGDIPPNSLSGPFWLRRVTASDTEANGYSASLSATPSGWSNTTDGSLSDNIGLSTPDNPPNDD
jgi:hypothetical protein